MGLCASTDEVSPGDDEASNLNSESGPKVGRRKVENSVFVHRKHVQKMQESEKEEHNFPVEYIGQSQASFFFLPPFVVVIIIIIVIYYYYHCDYYFYFYF